MIRSPADVWHSLLRPDVELTPAFFDRLAAEMRAERLTFGDRVHCPFLRPFFLEPADEQRVKKVAETMAALGERVVAAAMEDHRLFADVGLTEGEERLVRMEPGYSTASTASRLDAFLHPDSLQFAEYNAESPAGFGYAESLAELFDRLPVMDRFRERYDVRRYPSSRSMLDALVASYREWGGRASTPVMAIVDWREVPTWSEFEILQRRFDAAGIPTIICDPRDLEFDGRVLSGQGRAIDLVYRRVLINDILARPDECDALVLAYETRAACVANTFRCKIPHKKAFFAVLTDDRHRDLFGRAERDLIARHVPWTRIVAEGKTTRNEKSIDLVAYVRQTREDLVLKPNDEYGGAGVTLGWEADAASWDEALGRALADAPGGWVVQQRIAVRRERFPMARADGPAEMQDMLVDLAPYLFRGRLAGFLTRLSASGLANVTSGGGQVPAFVVEPRSGPE